MNILASFRRVLRFAAFPFGQERYMYWAAPLLFGGLLLLALDRMRPVALICISIGLLTHLVVGRSVFNGSPISTEADK